METIDSILAESESDLWLNKHHNVVALVRGAILAAMAGSRAQRNAAWAKLGLKVGDHREEDHKNPIIKGGSNRKDNLGAVARSTNCKTAAKL
jgi:hypothetical protein